MKRFVLMVSLFAAVAALSAAPLPITPYTVVAQVTSFEGYRAIGGAPGFSRLAPYGNDSTIIATILAPESLAGREIAIPYESRQSGKEKLVQKGATFRFEHPKNLSDLRDRTDFVRRRAIGFPERGILVVDEKGEVVEAHPGILTKVTKS